MAIKKALIMLSVLLIGLSGCQSNQNSVDTLSDKIENERVLFLEEVNQPVTPIYYIFMDSNYITLRFSTPFEKESDDSFERYVVFDIKNNRKLNLSDIIRIDRKFIDFLQKDQKFQPTFRGTSTQEEAKEKFLQFFEEKGSSGMIELLNNNDQYEFYLKKGKLFIYLFDKNATYAQKDPNNPNVKKVPRTVILGSELIDIDVIDLKPFLKVKPW